MKSPNKRKKLFFPIVTVVCLLLLVPYLKAEGEVVVTPSTVRVGMLQQASEVSFKTIGKYQLINKSTNEIIENLSPNEKWTVNVEEDLIKLTKDGEQIGAFRGPILLREVKYQFSVLAGNGALHKKEPGDDLVVEGAEQKVRMNTDLSQYRIQTSEEVVPINPQGSLNLVVLQYNGSAQRYRGSFEFRQDKVGLNVINELSLEEYLYGVVPGEMPSDWPFEALKAQSVAARSYVLRQMGTYSAQGFDVLSDQYSQVYRGYDHETSSTNRAVEETAGMVATYLDKPINAFYHSSSGGYTENSEDVWQDKLPYIRWKEDPYDQNNKHYGWKVTFTQEELLALLEKSGLQWIEVTDIEVLEYTASGKRMRKVELSGINQDEKPAVEQYFNADGVRNAFGLKSSPSKLEKEFDEDKKLIRVTFKGDGWGHGLGMSQYGARAMAQDGYTFSDILQYYYTDIEIKPNYGL
ncbi:SpoIID/LytB domain-containing protein [Desulfolucanica intricata]|uniref:SpoIID/LytB domain-containing protein n=1 Tax=Desulfolucanica intricata TaxID=1285191 RepID=UPI000AC294DA|nr:SpoIID/LytB domain-containing protein [Desulfolucanica intricata]